MFYLLNTNIIREYHSFFSPYYYLFLFLLDVIAKYWVRSGMLDLNNENSNIILLIIDAFEFFHPAFDLFICKAHIVVKIFHLHRIQVVFYFAYSWTGHGLYNGQYVVNNHGTVRVGSINVEFKEVFHDPAVSIHYGWI